MYLRVTIPQSKIIDFCHLPLKGKASSSSVQHIFDEDAISGGGVIHKHVGHGAHQFSVLNNGTALHADVK